MSEKTKWCPQCGIQGDLDLFIPVLLAEIQRLTDNPENDMTDSAYPAWRRGHDQGFALTVDTILRESGIFGNSKMQTIHDRIWVMKDEIRRLTEERDAFKARAEKVEKGIETLHAKRIWWTKGGKPSDR